MTKINLNQSPYFDDYTEDKKFYRILFRPGRAVQARELTQLQTALQKQIERFGSHVFQQGSQVLPGSKEGVRYVNNNQFIRIQRDDTYTTTDIQIQEYLLNKTLENASGVKATVIGYRLADSNDEVILYLNYIQASTDGQSQTFLKGEALQTVDTVPTLVDVINQDYATGEISSVVVEEGVYFFDGNFILVDRQTHFITPQDIENQSAWLEKPTGLVGLRVTQSLVTFEEDESLLDNALGSPNYSAPGADRLRISADIEQVNDLNSQEADFISLLKVIDGVVQARVVNTEYSVLEDTLARRTFDESGDYSVRPFQIQVKDFLRNSTNNGAHSEKEFYFSTEVDALEASENIFNVSGGSAYYDITRSAWLPGTSYEDFVNLCENKLSIKIDSGKAYVKGYEIEKLSTTVVDFDKARTLKSRNNKSTSTPLGTFFYVRDMYGSTTPYDTVNLYADDVVIDGTEPTNKIGTAKVLSVDFFSGTSGSLDGVYRLFLFDIKVDDEKDIGQLKSFYSSSPTFTCNCVLENFRLSGSVSQSTNANEIIGVGTSWKNDENERLKAGDYIQISNGIETSVYKVTANPENDNVLAVEPDPLTDSHTWVDGSTVDYIYSLANSNSDTAGLLYRLPDEVVRTITDVSYTKTLVEENLSPVTDQLQINNYDFDTFSTKNYSVINLSNGDWLEVVPYVSGSPIQGRAELQIVGNQLTIHLNSADALGSTFDVYISVQDTSSTPKTKNLNKGYFDGTGEYQNTGSPNTGYVISDGKDVSKVSLNIPDVLRITRVIESPDYSTDPSSNQTLPSGHKDVTANYILDNGQRDYFYDIASVSLRPNSPRPNGKVRVEFDYFTHTGNGNYFSVDSYPFKGVSIEMEYEEIPDFVATDGTKYDLSSCIDFRPVVSSPGGIESGFNITMDLPNSVFTCDYDFYLPRKDKLYLDKSGKFLVKHGVPDVNPQLPDDPDTGMVIYELDLLPYTANKDSLAVSFRDNKRYTMRDIGKLEKRISNLEYYTTLSLLESDTKNLTIKDALGNDKFKNGFLVDNFKTFGSCDLGSLDFKASVDTIDQTTRPIIYQTTATLSQTNLSNSQKTGELYTLPYTEVSLIEQKLASKVVSVNPFEIPSFVGNIKLTPWSDEWRDVVNTDPLLVKDQSHWEATQQSFGPTGTTIDYSSTVNNWTGVSITEPSPTGRIILQGAGHAALRQLPLKQRKRAKKTGFAIVPEGYANSGQRVPVGRRNYISDELRSTTTLTGQQITSEFTSTFVDKGWSNGVSLGSRIIQTDMIEFIREREIQFSGRGFIPNTQLYPFFDDIDVSDDCKPDGGNYGDALICDGAGKISGTFKIPNSEEKRFKTGDRAFRLTTSSINQKNPPPVSAGEVNYTARGWVDTQQESIYSTRLFEVSKNTVTSSTDISQLIGETFSAGKACPQDPIAQSFFVYEDGGCFLTSIDVFFYKKPTGDFKPDITLEVRTMGESNLPTRNILPFGKVIKSVDEITTNHIDINTREITITDSEGNTQDGTFDLGEDPASQMVATKFTFESPVYLSQDNSYCFVLISDSKEYKVWVAQSGEDATSRDSEDSFREFGEANTRIGTDTAIQSPVYLQGTFFKSENGLTWTEDQTVDMKFKLNKAQFNTSINGEIDFTNDTLSLRSLTLDPFETKDTSSLIRILHPNHGHTNNCKVVFTTSEDLTGALNGIDPLVLFQTQGHDIIQTELDHYVIDLGVGNEATSSGKVGGGNVSASESIRFEELMLLTTPLLPEGTDISWSIETITSKGVNDITTTAYQEVNPRNFYPNEKFYFDVPMQVSSQINADDNGLYPNTGEPSLKIKAILKSSNSNLSPIIDESRCSVFLVENRIDNPTPDSLNSTFDDFQVLPTSDSPAVTDLSNKIWFTTSSNILTGTVEANIDERVLTGTLTEFLSEVSIGDKIKIEDGSEQERVVIAINSDLELLVDEPFSLGITSGTSVHVNPLNIRLKTADSDVARHLSLLDIGKYITITGTLNNDRDITESDLVRVLNVEYTPNNTVVDSDLSNPKLCEITLDHRNLTSAGLESVTDYVIVQKDRFVDEIAPSGGSCSAKYVCKKLVVNRPSNSLKVMFDANRHSSCELELYYKLEPVNSTKSIDEINWVKADFNLDVNGTLQNITPNANEYEHSYSAYEATLNSLPSFTGAQVKIVMKGGNPARSPKVKNFRMIILDE